MNVQICLKSVTDMYFVYLIMKAFIFIQSVLLKTFIPSSKSEEFSNECCDNLIFALQHLFTSLHFWLNLYVRKPFLQYIIHGF